MGFGLSDPISAGIQGGFQYAGGKAQADAMRDAATKQAQATAAAQQFSREQAQNDWQNQETTRKANYDQWAARANSMNTIRNALGLGQVNVPAYVASVNPHFTYSLDPNYAGQVLPPGSYGNSPSTIRAAAQR